MPTHLILLPLQVVVIGGGYIGMECTAGVASREQAATLVFPEGHLMQRLFTPEIAAFYERFYADKGVKMVKQQLATSLEGEGGKVRAATTCMCIFYFVGKCIMVPLKLSNCYHRRRQGKNIRNHNYFC